MVHSKQLEKMFCSIICKLFDKSIGIIGFQHERVLLFTSDAAPYMTKAAIILITFYFRTIHITYTGS